MAKLAGPQGKVEIEQSVIEYKKPIKKSDPTSEDDTPNTTMELIQKCKSYTVYFGDLVTSDSNVIVGIVNGADFESQPKELQLEINQSNEKLNEDDDLFSNLDVI